MFGRLAGPKLRTISGRRACQIAKGILQQKGHALEWSLGGRLRHFPTEVVELENNSIQFRVMRLDALNGFFSQFGRCYFTRFDKRCEPQTVMR